MPIFLIIVIYILTRNLQFNEKMIPMSGEEPRYCWVCLANDQDEPSAQWVKPCRCRGTTKWVHQHCLQRWIDEKQRGNTSATVSCSACGTEYCIILPPQSTLLFLMEVTDNAILKICPFAAGVILLSGVYWTAVTYGAVTVMQVSEYLLSHNFCYCFVPLYQLYPFRCLVSEKRWQSGDMWGYQLQIVLYDRTNFGF